MIYFTSDFHLFHKNVLKFDNRPFKSVEDMHLEIIKRWNNKVTKDDIIYILGDVSFGSAKDTIDIIKQLNYKELHLIIGNHDFKILKDKSFRDLFTEICEYKELKISDNQSIVLCHYPIPCFKNHYYGWLHLYGHTHNTWEEDIMIETKNIINKHAPCFMWNVGIMKWDYEPVSLDEITKEIDCEVGMYEK